MEMEMVWSENGIPIVLPQLTRDSCSEIPSSQRSLVGSYRRPNRYRLARAVSR